MGTTEKAPRVVIVGGGFVGRTVAKRLQRRLRDGEAEVVLVDAAASMTYQPFLAEVAGGLVEPRHVAVALPTALRRTRVVTGRVTEVDRHERQVHIALAGGTTTRLDYDELVLAPGSVSRTQPIPGLAEHAIGFASVSEAERLRNAVLTRVVTAAETRDPDRRRRALTVVVVGGGYSGVEACAELHSLAVSAARRYPGIHPADLRFELIEVGAEIMPELPSGLAAYTRRRLEAAGITVRTQTQVVSMTGGVVELSSGESFEADTVVWAAGVRGNPLLARLGLPVDPRGRLRSRTTLQVEGAEHLWAAGDGAAVPDLAAARHAAPGEVPLCGATAQHAVRQARVLARNLVATLRGRELREYRHADAGSVATLGRHRGVARIYGVPLRGLPAWLLHRLYHLAMIPTWGCKVRVAGGWLAALVAGRDLVLPPEAISGLPADDGRSHRSGVAA